MVQTCSHAKLTKYLMIMTAPNRCFCTLLNKPSMSVIRMNPFKCHRNILIGSGTSETTKEELLQVLGWRYQRKRLARVLIREFFFLRVDVKNEAVF